MATQRRTVDFLLEQVTGAGAVTAKPMFGEYGVYVDGKMIGSVCDDQLFVKSTVSGRAHAERVSDVPPFPGAKPQMLIAADRWDNAEWLGELLRITAADLTPPKPRENKVWHITTYGERPNPSRPCPSSQPAAPSRKRNDRFGEPQPTVADARADPLGSTDDG